jgi:protein LTV1
VHSRDKNNSTTYKLFHRSQNDPLIHDPEADDRVLHPISGPAVPGSSAPKKAKTLRDLEQELGGVTARPNEGEAANYGVFYDDSEYDYMQHLRELCSGGGEAHFIDAAPKNKGKGKSMKLEDALREQLDLEEKSVAGGRSEYGSVYGDDILSTASSFSRPRTYQDQQDVPDEIAGFKPDMDPRLREALEALEDEAFVDEDAEDDVFGALVAGGPDAEVDPGEFRDTYIEDDEEGWESDATERPPARHDDATLENAPDLTDDLPEPQQRVPSQPGEVPDTTQADGDWMKNFAKYKKDIKSKQTPGGVDGKFDLRTTPSTLFTAGGTPVRKKKRKGALTNPSSYSMTSSSLARTDGHRLLDARFERIEALYDLDEEGENYEGSSLADDMSLASGVSRFSRISNAPSFVSESGSAALPSNFDDVMDGFLEGWGERGSTAKRKGAKAKRGKNGNEVAGLKMLDEVRQGLGPARFPGKV